MKSEDEIRQAQADYQPGQRRGDVVPVVELAMLAHLLRKHRAHVTVQLASSGQYAIHEVIDGTSEINPYVFLVVRP